VDEGGEFFQWFHFRVAGARGRDCVLNIENAGQAAYIEGWKGYSAVASSDRETWSRVPTTFEDGVLSILHTPDSDVTWYAYFAPYSWERHQRLIGRAAGIPGVALSVLGRTLDGHSMDLLRFGGPATSLPVIWVIARQHPGESMAEWFMEGLLGRLLDPEDPVGRVLRSAAHWNIVPNMNPDGSTRGHLRTNASGANLNREWHAPTAARSPEVLAVRDEMDRTGVDLCLDVHGDEGLPYNFIAGAEGIPNYSVRQKALDEVFCAALMVASPDFQRARGYPEDAPGEANMTMCTSAVAARYGCLAMTLEMPFKDNADLPDAARGWSPGRSCRLGADSLHAFAAVIAAL
jgi:murein tripeptide amidase MpaA